MSYMKKAGRYLLTVIPLLAGLGIQFACSFIGMFIYGIWYGVKSTAQGMEATEDSIMAGAVDIFIYILIASQIIAFIVFGIWYAKQIKGTEKRRLTQIVRLKTVGCIVMWGIGLQLATNLLLQLMYALMPSAVENYAKLIETAGIAQTNIPSVLATIILAPVVEEIMFRGITMRLAKKAGAGFLAANLIQAAAFGIYHANLVQGIYAFVLGFVLGIIAYKYDSIYPAILLHLAYNFAGTMLGAAGQYLPESVWTFVAFGVVSAVTFSIGMWMLKTDVAAEA